MGLSRRRGLILPLQALQPFIDGFDDWTKRRPRFQQGKWRGKGLAQNESLTLFDRSKCAIAQLQGFLAWIEKGKEHRAGGLVCENAPVTVPVLSFAIVLQLVKGCSSSLPDAHVSVMRLEGREWGDISTYNFEGLVEDELVHVLCRFWNLAAL